MKVIQTSSSDVIHESVKRGLYIQPCPSEQISIPVFIQSQVVHPLLLLLDAHVLFPPGLGQHLHLIGCAADLPLPPCPPIRLPQPHGDGHVKHLLQILLRQRRALHVRDGPDFFRQRSGIFLWHGPLPPPRQLDQHFDILPQVALRAYEEDGREGAAAADLWDPLLPHVLKGGGADHAEAEQQGVGAAVAEVPEFVKLILTERKKRTLSDDLKSGGKEICFPLLFFKTTLIYYNTPRK